MSLTSRERKRKKQKKIKFGLITSLLILASLVCVMKMDLPLEKNIVSEETTAEVLESENRGNVEEDDSRNGKQRSIDTLEKENVFNEMEEKENTEKNKEIANIKENEEAADIGENQEKTVAEKNEQAADMEVNEETATGEMLQKRIQSKLASMTLEEKIAQLFIITPESLTESASVTQAGEITKAALWEYPVGGLIFFEGNIRSEQQVTELLRKQQTYIKERIGLPLFMAVDEEGGQVTRLASCDGMDIRDFPDISEIGAMQDVNQALELGSVIGDYLNRMGFNLDFAPVADVLTNPENTVVKKRSYGSNPQLVSEMVKNNLKGLYQHQIYGCIKHFPGHGATLGDTHEGYAYTDKTWEELKNSDTIPFQDSISWGVEFIMVGHISVPQVTGNDVPASLSSHIINDLLRGELGYDGIVLTDALNMGAVTDQYTSSQAAVNAILAGNDMILMPLDFKNAYEGILSAVKEGIITEERLEESLERILRIKFSM